MTVLRTNLQIRPRSLRAGTSPKAPGAGKRGRFALGPEREGTGESPGFIECSKTETGRALLMDCGNRRFGMHCCTGCPGGGARPWAPWALPSPTGAAGGRQGRWARWAPWGWLPGPRGRRGRQAPPEQPARRATTGPDRADRRNREQPARRAAYRRNGCGRPCGGNRCCGCDGPRGGDRPPRARQALRVPARPHGCRRARRPPQAPRAPRGSPARGLWRRSPLPRGAIMVRRRRGVFWRARCIPCRSTTPPGRREAPPTSRC